MVRAVVRDVIKKCAVIRAVIRAVVRAVVFTLCKILSLGCSSRVDLRSVSDGSQNRCEDDQES